MEILSTDYTDWTWLTDKSQNFTTERTENAEKVLKREKDEKTREVKAFWGIGMTALNRDEIFNR